MVVVAALGAALGVAPRPNTHIHGVDGGVFAFSGGERVAGEQAPQSLGVDPSPVQSGVEAAPATLMRCLEAQMYGRGESVSGEEGVGEFEESVGPAMEAFIERAAEAVENVVGFHDASIMPSPNASRILYTVPGY
jgi:hypothetical protein